ncbi:hypothetical protein MBAV_001733 [Candidatus Magnetobacterium bavaricum]|uniref:Uncharacterized protein n=1 Tax=Candidatus Magnetobacterium bavaricum TaxID=29290 RepID=A0A0F3GZE4_9BACT|nr:hypothetical protein MBAV_001733 [Candidatus Magnetobacterium bavaricum]
MPGGTLSYMKKAFITSETTPASMMPTIHLSSLSSPSILASRSCKSAFVTKSFVLDSLIIFRVSDKPFACSSVKPEDFNPSTTFNVSNSITPMSIF